MHLILRLFLIPIIYYLSGELLFYIYLSIVNNYGFDLVFLFVAMWNLSIIFFIQTSLIIAHLISYFIQEITIKKIVFNCLNYALPIVLIICFVELKFWIQGVYATLTYLALQFAIVWYPNFLEQNQELE